MRSFCSVSCNRSSAFQVGSDGMLSGADIGAVWGKVDKELNWYLADFINGLSTTSALRCTASSPPPFSLPFHLPQYTVRRPSRISKARLIVICCNRCSRLYLPTPFRVHDGPEQHVLFPWQLRSECSSTSLTTSAAYTGEARHSTEPAELATRSLP